LKAIIHASGGISIKRKVIVRMGGIDIGTSLGAPIVTVEEALDVITDELAGARLDPEGVLRAALARLSKLRAGTWVATVMSKDPRRLMIVAADGEEPGRAQYVEAMFPVGEAPTLSFSQTVIETGEPVLVPQVSYADFVAMQIPEAVEHLETNPVPTAHPIDRIGFVVVAMRTRESTVGTLALFEYGGAEPLAEPDVIWLQAIADRVAIGVENGQMRVAAKSRLDRLTALRSIALAMAGGRDLRFHLQVILDQAIAGLGVNAADVLVLDEADGTLRIAAVAGFQATSVPDYRLSIEEALPGQLLIGQAGTSEFTPHEGKRRTLFAREGFRSRRAMPLLYQGRMTGVIEVFCRRGLEPDHEWLDFLEVLATAASLAIDRAGTLDRFERYTPRSASKTRKAPPEFSRLEGQILGLVVEGLSNAAIADQVHLSQHTIKFHVHRILQQAGVVNRTELARKATKEGWL
jgi:DNA-binding CsgD family transcriptional regulator/GAF domain-containing protein